MSNSRYYDLALTLATPTGLEGVMLEAGQVYTLEKLQCEGLDLKLGIDASHVVPEVESQLPAPNCTNRKFPQCILPTF